MIKEALQYVVGLSPINMLELGGRAYADKPLHLIKDPMPEPVKFHSLSGISEFANNSIADKEAFFLHVRSHCEVALVDSSLDETSQRTILASAHIWKQNDFSYGTWYDSEQFIINLQACFVDSPHRAAILSVVGNMTSEQAVTTEDDGVTQRVGQKAGVVLKSKADVPNPVLLAPYRTFLEVKQPESAFIFRVRQARDGQMPQCALFEADGGAWKLDAAKNVKAFLEGNADGFKVLL